MVAGECDTSRGPIGRPTAARPVTTLTKDAEGLRAELDHARGVAEELQAKKADEVGRLSRALEKEERRTKEAEEANTDARELMRELISWGTDWIGMPPPVPAIPAVSSNHETSLRSLGAGPVAGRVKAHATGVHPTLAYLWYNI